MAYNKEREALKGVYKKSKTWAQKVNTMPDYQVWAIFVKFRTQGKV